MITQLIARFDSKCRKHSIRVERFCVCETLPRGTSVRVNDTGKTLLVLPQTVTNQAAKDQVWDDIVKPLIAKGVEF